jgi:hypothetical protein
VLAVVDVNWTRKSKLFGLTIRLDGPNAPQCAVSIDQYNDPARPKHNNPNTTKCTLVRCVLIMPPRTGSDGVWISWQSKNNVEFCEFHDVTVDSISNVANWGNGFVVWSPFNAKQTRFIHCAVSYAANAFYWKGSGGSMEWCNGTGNSADVRLGDLGLNGPCDPVTIYYNRFENTTGVGVATSVVENCPITVEGNVWDAFTGPAFLFAPCRPLFVLRNKFSVPGAIHTPTPLFGIQTPHVSGKCYLDGNLLGNVSNNVADAYKDWSAGSANCKPGA